MSFDDVERGDARSIWAAASTWPRPTFPGMRERGWGRIVNIGSINGQAGQYGQVNYAAAKSGIHGFTKALAQEGAKFGVTVNAHRAGLYRYRHGGRRSRRRCWKRSSPRFPVGRLGHADEIARGVVPSCAAEDRRVPHRLHLVDQRRPAHVLTDGRSYQTLRHHCGA
jgi:acetoacetyl-CoA reductase